MLTKRVGKEEVRMPLYMDHHMNLEGLTAEAVAEDHKKDLEVQDKHGAKALTAVLIRVDPAANSRRGRTNLQYLQA